MVILTVTIFGAKKPKTFYGLKMRFFFKIFSGLRSRILNYEEIRQLQKKKKRKRRIV